MNFIWVTRGRSWGFRFLLDGGYDDPLSAYERAFAGMQGEVAVCRREGDRLALRFLDPLGRQDAAGRVIPHDFVIMEALADDIESVDDGREKVWRLVVDTYARVWSGSPPSAKEVQSAIHREAQALDVDDE